MRTKIYIMKRIILLFGLLMPLLMLAQEGQVTAEAAQDLLSENAILVDVRENDEVAELAYMSEGMMNIPLSELASRYKELPQDKTLIIACRSGNRSQKAITQLADLGITNTLNLEGGIMAWQGKGFPVIIDGNAPSQKACCAKAAGEGKSCCGGKAGEKACGSHKGMSHGSGKKS
jgi:rhodanese-related sulfurtransferase